MKVEVAIVGAGPAGLSAARAASESGASVALIDENPLPGGQVWRAYKGNLDQDAQRFVRALDGAGITHLSGATAYDVPGQGVLAISQAGSVQHIQYQRLILATGARELFLPFPGWTLPGVFGVGGLQGMIKAGLSVEGKRVVVAGSGPLLLSLAASLKEHGARVLGIYEQAPLRSLVRFGTGLISHPEKLWQAVTYRAKTLGIAFKSKHRITEASGQERVVAVRLSNGQSFDCDLLACSYGFVPNVELAQVAGCRMQGRYVEVDELQRTSVANIFCAGEPTRIGGVDLSVVEGRIAGYAATGAEQEARQLFSKRAKHHKFAEALDSAFELQKEVLELAGEETLLCRCEDVRLDDVKKWSGWREAKLQTRCGMGPCQGRICGAAASALFGWQTDPAKPPIFPTPVSALATNPMEDN